MEIKSYVCLIQMISQLKNSGELTEAEAHKVIERLSAKYELSPIYI